MNRVLLTGNRAAAWGARLANADYMPAFPITPQTEIIETLAAWSGTGESRTRVVMLESEHSMLTAAGAAAATGVRVFTATSSQGLLYAMEMIYATAGWRAPFVMVNVSRGVASPVTLESDHNDVLAARDSGFLQIHCATCQEVLDSVLIAYRLGEDSRVRLPVLVNQDGFYLSFTREPVSIPEAGEVNHFLPAFDAMGIEFRASRPASQAVAVLGGSSYSYFRYEMHLAAQAALAVYDEIAEQFKRQFGRDYPLVDAYRSEDADVVFFMTGAFSTKARAAVDCLRDAGKKVGLVRPRLYRPFPRERLRTLLQGRRAVAVVDQNISLGKGGVLATELASALYGLRDAPVIVEFIGGLGGRDISAEEFYEMAAVANDAALRGEAPAPRLLFTAGELREVRKLQVIAMAERGELREKS
ncbi:MAG: transketolase C-terminal domain-containing protein [Burkholderiales bacterium]